jgi:hypothetical protein
MPGIEPVTWRDGKPLRQRTAIGNKGIPLLMTLAVKLVALVMCWLLRSL